MIGALCARDFKGVGSQYAADGKVIMDRTVVRRLTPIECERLQGFPTDWTKVPYRGKPASECPDGPRYKAIGNSMTVNVMAWIGRRLIAHADGTLSREFEEFRDGKRQAR